MSIEMADVSGLSLNNNTAGTTGDEERMREKARDAQQQVGRDVGTRYLLIMEGSSGSGCS